MAIQASEGLLSPFLCHKRLAAVRPYLQGRVLDFGCGSGALAKYVASGHYLGVDIDSESLVQARTNYPKHHFVLPTPSTKEKFDTVVALAVIEHVSDPFGLLVTLKGYSLNSQSSCIVITTPHPSMRWVHSSGAALGLFSKHANEEHQALLGGDKLKVFGSELGLKVSVYRRFLFGTNQRIVYFG